MYRPIAITMGDPAGIGPEIIVKAFRNAPALTETSFVAGDVETIRRAARSLSRPHDVSMPVAEILSPEDRRGVPPRCVPVMQVVDPAPPVSLGQVSSQAGRMAADCVFWAARAALEGRVQAIVTAPLHKAALSAAGPPYSQFPGHTELLQFEAARFKNASLQDVPVRMMLASDELRTVLVSIHVSLRAAIEAVTFDNVLQTLRITHESVGLALQRPPRIGVAGLNPHAGESGLFGREEIEVIGPAVAAAQAAGIDAHGPYPPDTVFMRARSRDGLPGEFDVVVAMYHDQGLIPVKYLGLDKGVNITLGLPFVRTSPDHGTAFDIAGKGIADEGSLIEALRWARQLTI